MVKDDIVRPAQECPKCGKRTLVFSREARAFICSSCGYKGVLRS